MHLAAILLTLTTAPTAAPTPEAVALLRRACVECHGPDKVRGGLRLDSRAALLKGGDAGPAVVPGKPAESELLRRVLRAKGEDGVMPARGEPLGKEHAEVLRAWIAAGAPWPDDAGNAHWAYLAPKRPPPPAVPGYEIKNPIDAFVADRLRREKLSQSPAAAKEVLLRRLSLDLTGLPPTPAEIAAFERDGYEKTVDRLLASPQFGVRWARPWLDAARYADSHGFQRDDLRDLWPYRDWVVDAFNADLPFDRFTVEQLAGDLLPNPTRSQVIATGFNRAAPTNVEAGSDPEDTRVNQVFDRVNTVGTVWLGTTLECCQCHDHKYDPFPTKDYYRLFAFFNSTEIEANRANPKVPGSIKFLGPTLTFTDPATEAERRRWADDADRLRKRREDAVTRIEKADPAWEAALRNQADRAPREVVLDVADFDSLGGATHEVLKDGSVLLSGEAPDTDTYTVTVKMTATDVRAIKLEALTHPSLPGTGPGRGDAARTNFVLQTFKATAAPTGGKPEPVVFSSAKASHEQANYAAIDADAKSAWAIAPKFKESHWAVFETAKPLGFDGGTTLTFTLVQNFGSARTIGRLRLSAVTGDPGAEALPAAVVEAVKTAAEKRTPEQTKVLGDYRASLDPDVKRLDAELRKVDEALAALKPVSTLVLRELATPRPTHVLKRGDFRTPGDAVTPGTPGVLPPLPAGEKASRLDLARWLVAPENPLTARVTVNRLWAELFGRGLVATPEDFGLKGERPTHPELLDWLAVEFRENGWSVKRLLRTIVLSATYRQASRVSPEALARDDKNVLLGRGPRFRLDAEAIRDNALSIAGLLSPAMGGPSIRPPQPDGLWVKVGGERYDYRVSPGEGQYRRGLYVVWKRGAPYPSFMNFDATNRMACRVQRPRTNTPLQALTLLNDPVYVEATQAFARRVLAETPGRDTDARLTHAFRLAVARSPRPEELAILRRLYDAELDAKKTDLAAWYAVCAALLNLDETITKG